MSFVLFHEYSIHFDKELLRSLYKCCEYYIRLILFMKIQYIDSSLETIIIKLETIEILMFSSSHKILLMESTP